MEESALGGGDAAAREKQGAGGLVIEKLKQAGNEMRQMTQKERIRSGGTLGAFPVRVIEGSLPS